MNHEITVYGADWCGDTVRTKRFLDGKNVSYKFINIDQDKAGEEKVIAANAGKRRIPMVEIGSDILLKVPSDAELGSFLANA